MKKTLITIALTITASTAFAAMDHSMMDHSGMDHSMMKNGGMDHSKMDHSMMKDGKMDHSMMKNMGNHAHDSGSIVTVKPGKAKQLLWHFHGDNNVEFACNIAGHAEAGMVKSVTL